MWTPTALKDRLYWRLFSTSGVICCGVSSWREILPATKADFDRIIEILNIMANTLDDVLKDVTDESTLDDSIIALLTGIKAQLDSVLAGGLTPAQQAKVDAIFSGLEANKAKVSAAITANTPAAPTP